MLREVTVYDRFTVRVWRAGAGEPLVFLHGFEGHPGDAPFLTQLSQRFDVIAPELPGYAGSQQGAAELQDVVDYALFFRRFIEEQAGGPVALVGHDLGGMLAAEAAVFSPHLVRKLVLVDAFGLWLEGHEIPDVFVQAPKAWRGLTWADPQAEAAEQAAERMNEGVDQQAQTLNAQQNRAIAAKFLWAVPDRGLAKRLSYLQSPTLLLWGAEDRLIPPAYAEAFRSRLADARVELIPEAGHLPMLEQPEAFTAAVEAFLRS